MQHGFVQGRSCVTQLLSVLHDMGASLDAGEEIDVVYLDFSKAFDSVPHIGLLHKLSLFGIQGSLYAWFSNYLSSRYQRVQVDGAYSPWVSVTSGVPQGSLLGPFLFLLYLNDLPDVVSNSTSIALFADDAKCSSVVRTPDDCLALQRDLNCLYDWTTLWGLKFNTSKCEVLRISRKRSSSLLNLAVSPYTLDDFPLGAVATQKDLGVTVTNTLSWGFHISSVVAKANRKLGFLRRHFGSACLGADRKRLLYLAFVRSQLGYASEVWAPQSCIRDLKLLEGVQRRATRYILGCHRDPNSRPSYKSRLVSLNLLPISYWLECRDLLFLYKGVNGLLNFPLSNFIRFSTGRTRSAASSLNLRHFLRFRTSLFRDSYFIRIVYLWNDLPLSIRQTPSIKLFKTRLYEHYFKKMDCAFETDRIRTWKTICPNCRSIGRLNCC